MNSFLKKTLVKLKQQKLDGLFVTLPANISYLTKYESRDSYLLVSSKGCVYFTDSRYTAEAISYLKGTAKIEEINGSLFKLVAKTCLNLGLKRVGFEEIYLSFWQYRKLRDAFGNLEPVPVSGIVEELRQVKTRDELHKLRKAVEITVSAYKFIERELCPGRTELEIAAQLEQFIRLKGATKGSFDIIVASGPNSSYPHHITSSRKIHNNEPVLIDMGVEYLGYKSDLTRTFFLGRISFLARKAYGIVLEAQRKAIQGIRPLAKSDKIDSLARGHIAKKGFDGFFGHALGHGVGLETHEAPRISSKQSIDLKEGMVFTVEPGIYLPGKFGIRIEDMVLVARKGCEVLSGSLNK